jgi:hypothetical protein
MPRFQDGIFLATSGVADLDWNPNTKHSFAAKYYYQHDPTIAPYAFSMFARFSAASRRRQPGNLSQPYADCKVQPERHRKLWFYPGERRIARFPRRFTAAQFTAPANPLPAIQILLRDCTINTLGANYFPGIRIVNTQPAPHRPILHHEYRGHCGSLGAFTGAFQNRFNPSANAIWTLGKHTVTFGGSFSYTQLNARDERNELGTMAP